MKSVKFTAIALAAILSAVAIPALAQVMVGGAPMYSNKDIVDNAVNSKDHTTLVAAVKAAGLVPTLKGAARSRCSRRPTPPSPPCPPAPSTTCSSRRTSRR
jgi:hypothetical protein